jgi:hypothetical protein
MLSDAIRNHQSGAIRRHQTRTDAIKTIRCHQTPSDAIGRHQTPSDAIRRNHLSEDDFPRGHLENLRLARLLGRLQDLSDSAVGT